MKDLIQIAAAATEELAGEYSGNPEEEFLSWLQIALEREAIGFGDLLMISWTRGGALTG